MFSANLVGELKQFTGVFLSIRHRSYKNGLAVWRPAYRTDELQQQVRRFLVFIVSSAILIN